MKVQKSTRTDRQAKGAAAARSVNASIMTKQDRFGKYVPPTR